MGLFGKVSKDIAAAGNKGRATLWDCPHCDEMFSSRSEADRHIASKHGG